MFHAQAKSKAPAPQAQKAAAASPSTSKAHPPATPRFLQSPEQAGSALPSLKSYLQTPDPPERSEQASIHSSPRSDLVLNRFGAPGITVGDQILLSTALEQRFRQRVLKHELNHVRQAGGRRPDHYDHLSLGPQGTQEERQASAAQAVGSRIESYDLNRVRRFDPSEGDQTPAEGTSAAPVLFGLDEENQRYYLSVTHPGHSFAAINRYLHGNDDLVELHAENPNTGEFVPAGTILRPTNQELSPQAADHFNSARRGGYLMRSDGTPEDDPSLTQLYTFQANGTSYTVTHAQYVGLIRSSVRWVRMRARLVASSAKMGMEIRDDHEENTNGGVRWIADTWGGVSLPSGLGFDVAQRGAELALEALEGIEYAPESAEELSRAAELLRISNESLERADREWEAYIRGTIEGSESVISGLELTRNVSFGIAAGLAGAVVAPAVFAAAGGGLVGATAAAGGGTLAGATTGAGLELTSSVAGEGAALLITPGATEFDTDYVLERTWEGTKSGAIQGGIGAAGALAAPGLSNAVANRMFSADAAALTSTGQRLAVNATTAAIVGVPSGAGGAAIENVDDWYRGDMTGTQYAASIGLSGFVGGFMGAGTSWLPVGGLYRSNGRVVTPRWMMEGIGFQPHQVSPDFAPTLNPLQMHSALAGRYSFSPTGQGFAGFNALPLDQLPPLARGHRWIRLNGEWHPIATSGRFGDPYSLGIQGDNFNFLMGQRGQPQRLMMSRAITRPTPVQPAAQARPEMGVISFREGGPTGQPHTPGHNVAMADTPNLPFHATGELQPGATTTNTNRDIFNYTPEPRSSTAGNRSVSDWGQYLRGPQEGAIRRTGGGYRQYNSENSSGRTAFGYREASPTASSTPVVEAPIPDSVIFVETDAAGNATRAWRVDFLNPPTHNPPAQVARGLAAMANAPSRAPGTVQSLSELPLTDLPAVLQGNLPIHIVTGGPAAHLGDEPATDD